MNKDHKINFVYKTPNNEFALESVWAERSGDDYRIANIPFFAKNIAYADLVRAESDDGTLYFERLVTESGWSTIHVVIFHEKYSLNVIETIESADLSWEGFGKQNLYLALGIPPTINFGAIRVLLNKMVREGMIDYSEACISVKHKQ